MRIGKFGFLNNFLPYYWIEKFNKAEVIEASPKVLAEKIEKREIDYAPVPSFYYLKNKDKLRNYSFCVASKGSVLSVLVVSNGKALDNKIAITDETMTSVNLLKIILKERGLNCKLVPVSERKAQALLRHCGSALVIGDEAIKARMIYRVVMDLGEEWFELTGYPMVFGISASLKDVSAENCDRLVMESVDWGFRNFDEVVCEAERRFNMPREFLEEYFKTLTYRMGAKERKGLEIFEELCREHGLL
jgi:chorismate dehydratase